MIGLPMFPYIVSTVFLISPLFYFYRERKFFLETM